MSRSPAGRRGMEARTPVDNACQNPQTEKHRHTLAQPPGRAAPPRPVPAVMGTSPDAGGRRLPLASSQPGLAPFPQLRLSSPSGWPLAPPDPLLALLRPQGPLISLPSILPQRPGPLLCLMSSPPRAPALLTLSSPFGSGLAPLTLPRLWLRTPSAWFRPLAPPTLQRNPASALPTPRGLPKLLGSPHLPLAFLWAWHQAPLLPPQSSPPALLQASPWNQAPLMPPQSSPAAPL